MYGKPSHRRSSRSYSRSHRPHYRKKAVAVPKVKRTVKKYARSNALAINKLSRQVKYLQQAKYGCVQRNFQVSNLMIPLATQPIVTDIMDFSCRRSPTQGGARFGQYSTTSPPVLNNIGEWTPSTNNFHTGQNVDIPDTGKYLALSCHVTMRFQGTPSAIDTRIRVDLFSVRAGAIGQVISGGNVFAMPTSLIQLTNLANPELNKLGGNPYLKVWATKWLYLSSSRNMTPGTGAGQAPGPAVTGNSGYLSFHIAPKGGKLRNQNLTVPYTPGDSATIPDGIWGFLNVPQDEPLYMLISSSDPTVVGPAPNLVSVQCSRTVTWRDPVGKSSL